MDLLRMVLFGYRLVTSHVVRYLMRRSSQYRMKGSTGGGEKESKTFCLFCRSAIHLTDRKAN